MIFVTVGTQNYQFNRLLKAIDQLVEEKKITEPVFAQIGHSDYVPNNYPCQRFLAPAEFEKYLKECDLLITHSGVATIIAAKKYKKKVIVFPRLSRYHEHVDDHQLQIAETFANLNLIFMCTEEHNLYEMLMNSRVKKLDDYETSNGRASGIVGNYLKQIEKEKKKQSDNKADHKKLAVLMVGVDKKRIGGMWTVSETYMNDTIFNEYVDLTYVATNTYGSALSRIWIMLIGYLRILSILVTKKIDIVHIHMAEKGSTYRKGMVVYMAKLFHKKTIVQLHAGPFMAWYNTLSRRKQRQISSFFAKADQVLALGDFWKEQLKELVDEEKLQVLYNGSFCPEKNPYNPAGKKILYLGVMKRAKGTWDLINAMKLIDDRLDPEVKLYLCGTPEEEGFEEEIRLSGLKDRVEMLGWISKEQRLELFKEAQIVVHPSYFEALSMTIIEAICYGIPVIATDISTSPELLGEDIERVAPGDYEAFADQILNWVNDQALREKISDSLYKRAKEKFSVEKNISDTLRIYEDVLK